ncbi:hypothetical protein RchiOBHm_Chr1g0320861 [Rosa chinensis]|uniref:DUF4283 domain-containing protein n=1 Tax=Rosa chinensis TaxID=74649 RepID=A0A2P6S8X2_ROSCH|nr:hypothetical protein RchiOBHm_Chr1g0320861 [Rosa chinensis]
MASIDAVTASFAASLALADGGKAPDLGRIGGGSVRRSSHSFLLGKPLTRKPVDPSAFKAHFLRTWLVDKEFRVQERADNHFLFSFGSVRDRNKVLKGGVWCYDHAPVCLEEYDGVLSIGDVPMKHIRIWVRVSGIPPLYEEPDNLILVGNLLGGYLDYDKKEFRKGIVRILFSHDISKPVLLERRVFLATGVEPTLKFQFEHLKGRCSQCGLITHSGEKCEEPNAVVSTPRVLRFGGGPPISGEGFSFSAQSNIDLPLPSPTILKKKKPVIRRQERSLSGPAPKAATVPNTAELEGMLCDSVLQDQTVGGTSGHSSDPSSEDLIGSPPQAVVKPTLTYKKRVREEIHVPSPKKFKTILGGKFLTLQADALGLVEVEDDVTLVKLKKKLGRPLGSKNKGPRSQKKAGINPLRLTYPSAKPVPETGPSAKGKGKL